jgi:hypothetical protein
MIFPQNEWGNVVPPYEWSLARNIPLTIQGVDVGILLYKDEKENSNSFSIKLSILIFISYGFYLPVILLVKWFPLIGMLMIPKTLAYMAMAVLSYNHFFKKN